MQYIKISSFAFLLLCLAACGNSAEVSRLTSELDSLRSQNQSQQVSLNNYLTAIETINATLDSLDIQDKLIFMSDGEATTSRDKVLANLDRFELIIVKQQQKVRELERELQKSPRENEAATALVQRLQQQVASKSAEIARLKDEIENKNADISRLRAQVESQRSTIATQTQTITDLTARTQKQSEALARQDAMLNNGYVLIGTKDDLERKGILKKGKIVADGALDRSKFFKVDIRKWREISFEAKKPKILTNIPASSYELTTSGDHKFKLTITNAADFWRISNYLVIQTN